MIAARGYYDGDCVRLLEPLALKKNQVVIVNVPDERENVLPRSLMEAVSDSRERRNLHGPFDSAAEAVASMLED